jgi:hypothetical protein
MSASNSINVEVLTTGSLPEILEAIRCGELAGLACLCDPEVRDAVTTVRSRFGLREQAILWRQLCGCAIKPTEVKQTAQPTPIGGDTIPVNVVKPVEPTPTPTPTPVPVGCNPALLAQGAYTKLDPTT